METIFARFAWFSGQSAIGNTDNAELVLNLSFSSVLTREKQHIRVTDRTLCLTLKMQCHVLLEKTYRVDNPSVLADIVDQ
jgi:hypothetical protein